MLSDWRNEYDVTEYVKECAGSDMNMLLCNNANSTTNSIKVYSSDAKDVTLKDADATVFKGEDLKPQLIVEYTLSSGIENVETEATDAEQKIYTISGVRVSKVTAPGIYIVNGKKMVINK